MKKWIVTIVAFVVVAVCGALYGIRYNGLQRNYETAVANNKAYEDLLAGKYDDNRTLQLTIEQLQESKDSLMQCMDSVRKERKVKDSQLKEIQYISSTITKTDTIVLKDTVLRDKVKLDTVVGDAWYSVGLKLRYPDTLQVTPRFRSSKYITTYTKKEYIKPKKCWVKRLFQKKHKVTVVDITEESPYIEEKDARQIEIVE